jgi:tRNA(Ile)-lysidine synthase
MTPARGARGPGTLADALADRLRRHVHRTDLIPADTPVVVALSGGLDSVVLLHLLRFPLGDRAGPLAAAHLDHRMRPDSDADARWVQGLCRAWDVPLEQGRADPPPRSEAEARHARYAFLHQAAERGAPHAIVVTAHHADDQAETILFRLARGTGLRGLRGIAPRRGRVVRPLLPFARADLEAYALEVGLAWRTDPTNLDLRYARNRIRHAVLPELERARPGATRALATLASQARAAEAALDGVLDRLEGEVVLASGDTGATLARPGLLAYHPHLQARLLRRLLRRYGAAPGRAGTRAALEFITTGSSGGSVDLPAGVRLERDFERIRIAVADPGDTAYAPSAAEDAPLRIMGPEAGRGVAVVAGRRLEAWWGSAQDMASVPGGAGMTSVAGMATMTMAAPRFPLLLRRWQPGDRIRLGYGRKKLKKLLAERRLDRRERSRVPVLVDGAGEVLWVVGLTYATGVRGDGDGFHIAVWDAGQH